MKPTWLIADDERGIVDTMKACFSPQYEILTAYSGQDASDRQALDRLESCTARIEQYVEAMSSIQRLEQMPIKAGVVSWAVLRSELAEGGAAANASLQISGKPLRFLEIFPLHPPYST